jgi:hypothetical protein
MLKTLNKLIFCASLLAFTPLSARDLSIEITNLTHATYFTPLLVAIHDHKTDLFEPGREASYNLQAMAEGGDISGLLEDVLSAGGDAVVDPAGGLLAPGQSTRAQLELEGRANSRLSIVAMLLPTNDGFVGLDALKIPRKPGSYTLHLTGYDAGTEANDELITGGGAPNVPGIPADPGGNAGTGGISEVAADHNQSVHVHRGILGDMDPLGGSSDLDSRVHRWINPVARVVLQVGSNNKKHDDD